MKSTIELSDFQMYINVFHFVWNKFISSFRVNDEDVRLMLWDTAGQEEFDAITKAYYRGKIRDSSGWIRNTAFLVSYLGFLLLR